MLLMLILLHGFIEVHTLNKMGYQLVSTVVFQSFFFFPVRIGERAQQHLFLQCNDRVCCVHEPTVFYLIFLFGSVL